MTSAIGIVIYADVFESDVFKVVTGDIKAGKLYGFAILGNTVTAKHMSGNLYVLK